MIHGGIQQDDMRIKRQSSRATRVTSGQAKETMPIQIISTYAPHSGHKGETRQQHWGDVTEHLNKTSKQHLIIWGADENGQIGNNEKTNEAKHKNNRQE